MENQRIELKSKYYRDGRVFDFRYFDVDQFTEKEFTKCTQIYGVCFYNDKIVIVLNGKNQTWGLVGGHPEDGEKIEEAFMREVQEETNMRVLSWRPVGIQEVTNPEGEIAYQFRVVAKVEPLGEFICDPAGTITQIKLIDPTEYKAYFDWGEIGDHIVTRAMQLESRF